MIKFPEGLEDDYLQSFMILPDHNLDPWNSRDEEAKNDEQKPT